MIVLSNRIRALMEELKKNNLETYCHSLKVKKISNKIILLANDESFTCYTPKEIDYICKGALLHDVGKLEIRNFVLTKESMLSDEERSEILDHPQKSYELIRDELDEYEREIVKNVTLYHHERIDGNGYYKKTDIPLYVQIVSISDVFEALTSERPYHDAMPPKEALALIKSGGCGVFDEKVTEYLEKAVNDGYEI